MSLQLTTVEQRVLGALMEKETTTPEQYPLSLNALINACNQRSSRDPVMDLEEEPVRQALHALQDLGLVRSVQDGRVPKFENVSRTILNLRRDEAAVICLLLLRGPQTPGELRSRADRLYTFDELAAVSATLERLATRLSPDEDAKLTGPLVVLLPRQPGSREARYAHLLGGPVEIAAPVTGYTAASYAAAPAHEADPALAQRVAELESLVTLLQGQVTALEGRLGKLLTALGQNEEVGDSADSTPLH